MDYFPIFSVSFAGVSHPCPANNFDDVHSVTVQRELAAESRVGLSKARIPPVTVAGEGGKAVGAWLVWVLPCMKEKRPSAQEDPWIQGKPTNVSR